MKNKYKKQSHISISKTREIIKCFALDLTATNTAKLTDISRQIINISIGLERLLFIKLDFFLLMSCICHFISMLNLNNSLGYFHHL